MSGNPSPTKQSLPSRSKSPIASEVLISLTEIKCKNIIDSLISKFTDFNKPIYKGSGSTKKYKVFLAKLCDLAPSNLKELLQGTYRPYKLREEDWQFYLNMCKAKQVGCVVGMDVKLAVK